MIDDQLGSHDKLKLFLNMNIPAPTKNDRDKDKEITDLRSEVHRLRTERDYANRLNSDLRGQLDKLKTSRQQELERLREEFRTYGSPANALRLAANKAKQDNEFVRKLFFAFAQYGEEEIAGFDVDSPDALIKLIESELKAGNKTTYAAVCLVLLNKRYQDVVRKNAILSERNAKLANAIKAAATVAITN